MTRPRFVTVEVSDPDCEVEGLRHVTAYSRALGRRADCTLWAPEGVAGPLPLVVLLHGVYGSHWAWAYKAGAHRIAAALIAAGDIAPIALAMPSDGLHDLGSGYVAGSGGDAEGWIVDEVPALAAHVLDDVSPDAPFALAGLSMGGFGALLLGARHGERIHAAAGLSSMTELDQIEMFVGSYEALGVPASQHVVADALSANRDRLPRLYLTCGADDPLLEHNRTLHRRLDGLGIPHEHHEPDGRHDWEFWRSQLPAVLRFLAPPRVVAHPSRIN